MHKKVYQGPADRLRRAERLETLQVDRVVDLCLRDRDIRSVLDAGTGSGVFAEAFHRRGLKIAGIDINPQMIEAARQHVPEGEFKVGELEQLPYEVNRFDLVFYAHALHEADGLEKALSEAKRVASKYVAALEWQFKITKHGPPLWHRIKVGRLRRIAKKLGFVNVEVKQVGCQNLFLLTI